MNFLAHIYLSGGDDDIMLGNFMADAVKGRQFEDYPEGVKKGILLHRFIDDFTDTHPIVTETKVLFRPIYHKLSPILVDMIYDHYLAKLWPNYHPVPLREFVNNTYAILNKRKAEMPERVRQMLPYMIQYDWLYNYQFQSGMEQVLMGMSRRVPKGEVLKHGWRDLVPIYEEVQGHFELFFAELEAETKKRISA